MPDLPFVFQSHSRRTLRPLCGRSQKTFRLLGLYTGVGLLEGDSHTVHNEVRV
jgi:hypothetical protein